MTTPGTRACICVDSGVLTFENQGIVSSGQPALFSCPKTHEANTNTPEQFGYVTCRDGAWEPRPQCLGELLMYLSFSCVFRDRSLIRPSTSVWGGGGGLRNGMGGWGGGGVILPLQKGIPATVYCLGELFNYLCIPTEVRRGEYWGLRVLRLQYFPLVKI